MPSKPSRKKSDAAPPGNPAAEKSDDSGPTFEEALGKLEELVATMESDDLPLEQMIEGYREGVRLRDICEGQLRSAQARVDLIRDGGDDKVELSDFASGGQDSAATETGRKAGTAENESKDTSDGELF